MDIVETYPIPLTFSKTIGDSQQYTEKQWKQRLPCLNKSILKRYFVPSNALYSLKAHQIKEDIYESLQLIIVDSKYRKRFPVDRIDYKKIAICFFALHGDEAYIELSQMHPNIYEREAVIVPNLSEFDYQTLHSCYEKVIGLTDHFCIRNDRFTVKDIEAFRRLLEKDDALCSDSGWESKNIVFLGKEFLIELPPSRHKIHEDRPSPSGLCSKGSGSSHQRQTVYNLINKENTLEFLIVGEHDPDFLFEEFSIRKKDCKGAKKDDLVIYVTETWVLDIAAHRIKETTDQDRVRIGKAQEKKANYRSSAVTSNDKIAMTDASEPKQPTPSVSLVALTPQHTGLCQIMEDRSVRYGKKTYKFRGPERYRILRELIKADGDYVSFDKPIKPNFQKDKEALSFFNQAIEAEGKFRNGTGRYRIKPHKKQKALR